MKETFKLFVQNSIDEKQKLLLQNSISDEDKALIQEQIDNLNDMVAKIDAMEESDETSQVIDELKQTVNEMAEKLQAINEKLNQNKEEDNNEQETENEMKYLETKNALHDYVEVMKNSKSGEEFRNNWKEVLIKNDAYTDTVESLDDAENFMPAAVKGVIESIWDSNAEFLRNVRWTGAKRYVSRYNNSDQTYETSRAKGHKKGDTKASQKLAFTSNLIDAQYIYKLVELSKQTYFESDEELIRYLYTECTEQLIWEVKKSMLVGDSRDASDPYKIDKIEALYKDTTDQWTTVFSVGDGGTDFYVDDCRMAVDSIHNPNNKPITVFLNKKTLRKLARVQASETSTPVFLDNTQVASQLGCSEIITTDLLDDDAMIAVILGEYYMVGDRNIFNPAILEWEDGLKNILYHRAEVYLGGHLNGLKSSAVIYVD